jgi:hypothetical protein
MAIAGEKQIERGQRCGTCGRRSVSAGTCSACGEPAIPVWTISGRQRQRQLESFDSRNPIVAQAAVIATTVRPLPVHGVQCQPVITSYGIGRVRGRVIVVKSSANEPMDFDPWRWIAIPAWGFIILILPIVVAIVAWRSTGFIGAVAVALTTFFALRFMFSNRLLQSWHFVAALSGKNVVEMMPVVMIRLRQADEREIQLRLKGQLPGGTVIEGDRISAAGIWSRGVFHVRHISCERTGATIVPQQPTARSWAIAGVCVLVCAGLWLHFVGVPWVAQQARGFQPPLMLNGGK